MDGNTTTLIRGRKHPVVASRAVLIRSNRQQVTWYDGEEVHDRHVDELTPWDSADNQGPQLRDRTGARVQFCLAAVRLCRGRVMRDPGAVGGTLQVTFLGRTVAVHRVIAFLYRNRVLPSGRFLTWAEFNKESGKHGQRAYEAPAGEARESAWSTAGDGLSGHRQCSALLCWVRHVSVSIYTHRASCVWPL